MDSRLAIQTLGGVTVTRDGDPVEFGQRKTLALLVYLACHPHSHPREVLAEMLWEDRTQAQSLANLRVVLTDLRQTVKPFVCITRETIGIEPDSDITLDVTDFEHTLDVAAGNASQLESALAMYQGDFLAGFYVDSAAFETWATRERERLRLRAMEGLDRQITGCLEQGNYAAGIAAAARLLDMDALREETYRQIMDLLARSGQRTQALEQYDRLCRMLDEEFGLTPLPETVALYEQLRAGELPPSGAPVTGEAAPTPIRPAVLTNPYKGLCAFEEHDAADFFGREALTERLLAQLAEDHDLARFLAVVGPSGSGKSSVVRAGVIPALRRGALPGSDTWSMVTLLPGAYPFDELEMALRRAVPDAPASLNDDLRRDARGLLRAARLCLPDESRELLLVIDQFEEVFTLVDNPAEARRFIDNLYVAATTPRSPVRILITLRADFYDRPLMIPNFSELVRQRTAVVTPMTPDELERAVVRPAERVGVALEPGLVTAVVAEVSQQPGALPLMEYALTEVFERRTDHTLTQAAYETIGGALGALARRAEDVYRRLNPARQAATRQMCLRLISLGEGTEDTRRRALQTELISAGGEATRAVLYAFDRTRLLTFDHDPRTQQPTVELAHEAVIREWEQLRTWLDESRHDIRMQRLLAAAAAEWQRAGQETSYLLSGARLAQFEDWAAHTDIALTVGENVFLDASIVEDRRRRARRRRVRNTILSAAVVVALLMAALALIALNQERQAQNAQSKAEREAEVRQSVALAASAKEVLLTNDTDLAIVLALEANTIPDPPVAARQALAAAVYAPGTRRVLTGHGDSVNSVAISPDGRYALSGGGLSQLSLIRGTELFVEEQELDTDVRLWDLETGREIRRFEGPRESVTTVAFSPDQALVLAASLDGTLYLWEMETGASNLQIDASGEILCALFSPDGRFILSGSADQDVVSVWDVQSGDLVRRLTAPGTIGSVWSLAFSHTGHHAFAGFGARGFPNDGSLVQWDWTTGEVVHEIQTGGNVRSLAVSPDDSTLLAATYEPLEGTFGRMIAYSIISLFDLQTGQELHRCRAGWAMLSGLAFSPDGRQFVSASHDQLLILWDVETGGVLRRLTGHTNRVNSVAFSPDGQHLLSGSEDGTLRYWDIHNGAEVFNTPAHMTRVGRLAFSPDGRLAVSSSAARELFLWDVTTGQVIRRFQGHNSGIFGVVFSADGQTIVSGSWDRTIRQWDVNTGEELRRLTTTTGTGIWDLSLSPDGRYVLAAESGATITPSTLTLYLRDFKTGDVVQQFSGHTGLVWDVAISPDGQRIVSVAEDDTVRVWNLSSGQEQCSISDLRRVVSTVDVGPDSRTALLGAADGRVALVDVQNCQIISILEGHSQLVLQVSFSPDGDYGLSCSEDSLVILWDLTAGVELRRFEGHAFACRSVDFSPDGRFALSGGDDGEVILWRLSDTPEEIIVWAHENRYVRELTCTEREKYDITPRCDADGNAPTGTPYPTLTPSLSPSLTPTLDLTRTTVTPTWTPLPSNTPQTNTAVPTTTLVAQGSILFDVPTNGMITGMRDTLSRDSWTFEGAAGQTIRITNNSVDKLISVYAPDGSLITESTSTIGPVVLPATGIYTLSVQAGSMGLPGVYTFTVSVVD